MDAEELVESIIRGLMFLAGILGNNWLALRSLPRAVSGIRTSEVLFINLAVSNLITNLLVDLPDTMADFAGRWFLGETYCGVFRFCADLSETSSIFTTFFISAFWHQKLVGSLKRGGAPVRMDSLRLVVCLLAAGWTVAVVFSIPHFFFFTVEATNDSEEDCVDFFPDAAAGQTYEILYLTLANALPLAGIVSVSVQIVITLLKNQRRIRSHKSEAPREAVQDKGSDTRTNDRRPAGTGPEEGTGPDAGTGPEAGTGPGNSKASHIYMGVPASSGPNAAGHTSNHSNNTDGNHGDQPRPSKPPQMSAKPNASSQVRAAKSVVAVASVFLVCWLTHLLLRITNNIHTSSLVVEVASYIAASYTCIIPYIFLYGVKKLSCSCKR